VFVVTEQFFEKVASAAPSKDELEALIRALKSASSAQAASEIVAQDVPTLAPFLTDYWGMDPAQRAKFLPQALFALGYLLTVAGLLPWGAAMMAAGAVSEALRIATGSSRAAINVEDAVQRGAEAALESHERQRRERNREKRARRAGKS
jgi:hypothetical protein